MPGEPVVLETLGGMVATSRPEDLPEGASPRANDVDFIAGRFIQRPGEQNVYTNVLSDFGPEAGTVAADIDTRAMPWTNPDNILLDDSNYATISLLGQYEVSGVVIDVGGYYALSETPIVTFSGPGAGGATGTVNTTSFGTYKVVSSVTITAAGNYSSFSITATFTGAADPANDAMGQSVTPPFGQFSDTIRVTGFSFAIPSTYQVKGLTVKVNGFSTDARVVATLVRSGIGVVGSEAATLPVTEGTVTLGGSTDLWGVSWTVGQIDDPSFGVELFVSSESAVSVSLGFVSITISGTPAAADFTGLMDVNLNQSEQTTLALDGNGLTWKEDVTSAPNVLDLESLIPPVAPGSYMKGLDANGVAFMAYSDLKEGTSQPMQYNGEWCDRITQVGPGAAPVFTPQQTTSDTFDIDNIDQPAQAVYGFAYYLQSNGPGSTAPGNVVTFYYADSTVTSADADLVAAIATGYPVYLYTSFTGTPTTFGPLTVQVTSIGLASPPGQPRQFYYFTFTTTDSAAIYYQGSGHSGYTCTFERTLATMTTVDPVPGLEIGNIVTIAANSVAGYNASWSITEALNSGAMAITSTAVTAGVATYNYTLQSGTAPAAGELVTVTSTTNANGGLNVTGAVIVTASGGGTGNFTVNVAIGTDYASSPESGQAVTAGTIFCFDPGVAVVGTSTNPIFGLGTGGTLTFEGAAGQLITPGWKQGSVFFITRNGAVTRPAPPTIFTVPSNCGAILATQIPIGPPDVVARGITFTESGQNGVPGASFYTYDTPVSFTVNGITYTASALIVLDNTTTSMKFSFSDSVLLASDEIDVQGNNYFALKEIGSPVWMFQYAERMLYGLCQTQIANFLNLPFDGGYLPTYSSIFPMPTAWTAQGIGNYTDFTITAFLINADVVNFTAVNSLAVGETVIVDGLTTGTYLNGINLIVESANGTSFTAVFTHANVTLTSDSGTVVIQDSSIGLVPSLDFGNAFRMTNYGDAAWTDQAVLFQTAYQDHNGVAILLPSTPYSVRVKARSIGVDAQTVTIKLLSFDGINFGAVPYGEASFSFNEGTYEIQIGTLLTGNGFATVPADVVLALGVDSVAVAAGLEVDRIEIFPTNKPTDTTTIWTSYASNFEAVDEVTGSLGVGTENAQPAVGAFELLEQLYIEKTKSLQVTQDSPNYEPNNWQVRQASDRNGAVGPNAFDEGEEFTVAASRSGLFFFDGGKPMPISQELQSSGFSLNLWDAINWNAGSTIWVRNNFNDRRLLVGIPLPTPNFWLPNAEANAAPSSPNVLLMLNYTGCPTGEEMAEADEVHVTMFGDVKAIDMRRKWALWQIKCPIAEFITRGDGLSDPLFLANGIASSKIYQLVNGAPSGGQNTDDGAAINWSYTSYGLVKAKQGQQVPSLGTLRKVWYYLAATMEGVGKVACKLYSNSLGALPRNTFTIPLQFTLSYPQQNDQERVLEIGGQRVFIEFSSVGTGGYAEVGPVIIDGEMDKNSPHRGVSS